MAYSDYVQIYNVAAEAGITGSDDVVTQVNKVVDWINANFGDEVTAENLTDDTVKVLDKKVGAGFGWYVGGSCRVKWYKTGADTYTSNNETYIGDMNANNLQLFVCKINDTLIMDFINKASTNDFGNTPRYMRFSANNGEKIVGLCAIGAVASGTPTYWQCIESDALSITSNTMRIWYEYFGCTNSYLTDKTLLTALTPFGSSSISDSVYRIQGHCPANKSIFELNGTKYLCLKHASNSSFNIYDYVNLAIKLD